MMYRPGVRALGMTLLLLTVSIDRLPDIRVATHPFHVDAPPSDVDDAPLVEKELEIVHLPPPSPCPEGMVSVQSFCIDQYEAPNRPGEQPVVMLDAAEAETACMTRGARLCWRDEWERACGGSRHLSYPYGPVHIPGTCNSDKKWISRNESRLNTWPADTAMREVERIWQGEPSGSRSECASPEGVYDLTGNVEEWTRRRDGGGQFRHAIKGGFWAREVSCAYAIESHADQFRYYEVGYRCCSDPTR